MKLMTVKLSHDERKMLMYLVSGEIRARIGNDVQHITDSLVEDAEVLESLLYKAWHFDDEGE